jgi:hypothetical protein
VTALPADLQPHPTGCLQFVHGFVQSGVRSRLALGHAFWTSNWKLNCRLVRAYPDCNLIRQLKTLFADVVGASVPQQGNPRMKHPTSIRRDAARRAYLTTAIASVRSQIDGDRQFVRLVLTSLGTPEAKQVLEQLDLWAHEQWPLRNPAFAKLLASA